MKLIAACIVALVALVAIGVNFQIATAAVAAGSDAQPAVGLYAPDRYDGIPDMCLMPMDFGYCRAKVKRYYFDMRRMKCAMFYWGGCAGNINNFKSIDECNKVCLDDNYIDDVNSGGSSSSSSSSNQNVKNNNINNKSFKVNSNYKNEQRRSGGGAGVGVGDKLNKNTNNNKQNDQNQDQEEEDEDYQQ